MSGGCTDSMAVNYAVADVDDYDESSNYNDGSCLFMTGCEELGLTTYSFVWISCDGGSWQGEVSWTISGTDGSV